MTQVNIVEPLALSMVLLLEARGRRCALPLSAVREVFRPLLVEPLGHAPDFVLGWARVRGSAVPVMDLDRLLGGPGLHSPGRWISLAVEGRGAALAVDAVPGLLALDPQACLALPPLLAEGNPAVESMARLDRELLLVLQAARLLPPEEGEGV